MLGKKAIAELRAEEQRFRRQADRIRDFLAELTADECQSDGNGSTSIGEVAPEVSFASKVRSAMRKVGASTTCAHIASTLIEMGEPPEKNGKPLKATVAVELYRMAKKGTGGVQKVSRGRYRIMPQD